MYLLALIPTGPGFPLIIAAGVAMYIACKAGVDAIVGGAAATPGRLAVGQALPIFVLAVAAMLTNRPQVAVGVVFSTAVACLSLAAGTAVAVSPPHNHPVARRGWAMLVPAGLLAFLAGFGGKVSAVNGLLLAIQGLVVFRLWNDRAVTQAEAFPKNLGGNWRDHLLRSLQAALAIALAAIGAWLAMQGIDIASATTEIGSAGLLTAAILSPMLVLPIIGVGTELAHKQQSGVAVSSHVGVALLNVFVLLPCLVLISYRHEMMWNIQEMWAKLRPTSPIRPLSPQFHSELIFPLAVWRVDVVMMIALGLLLLPVAIGRWSLTKMHGVGMILAYIVYLGLSLLVGVRKV